MSQPLFQRREPAEAARFPLVLSGGADTRMRATVGVGLALMGYLVLTQIVSTIVLGIADLIRRPSESFADYYAKALTFALPEGMLAAHLGLATMIVLALVLVRFWHGVDWHWGISVQPGMRWRFLVICLLVAMVVLNAAAWLQAGGSLAWAPESSLIGWLVLIVLTSPLQAAGEEFLFRGYLIQSLGAATRSTWAGVVVSAVIFALLHGTQNLWLFADRLAFGLVAGALVVFTGGLEASIGAHVVNNVFAFSYAAMSGGIAAARTTQTIGPAQAGFDIGGFVLYGVIAVWIGRRMNLATRV